MPGGCYISRGKHAAESVRVLRYQPVEEVWEDQLRAEIPNTR